MDIKTIDYLNNIASSFIVPSITVLFDIDPEVSYKRILGKEFNGLDRIEKQGVEFQKKVRRAIWKQRRKIRKDFL